MQVVGQAMRFCRYSVQDRQHSFPIAGIFYDRLYQPHELAISGANADLSQPPRDAELSQPFQAVLASLVPPHQPLRCLSLSKCQLQPAALQDCSALGALSELHLRHCCGQATSLSDALAPLLQQTPRLERLTLHACMQQGDPFPASLLALSGPTFLSLTENFLEGLPEGPCWAGENMGAGLPPCLQMTGWRAGRCTRRPDPACAPAPVPPIPPMQGCGA